MAIDFATHRTDSDTKKPRERDAKEEITNAGFIPKERKEVSFNIPIPYC
jgi:hypothetical protein